LIVKVLKDHVDDKAEEVADQIIAAIAKGQLKFPAKQWGVEYERNEKAILLGSYDEYQLALAMQLQLKDQKIGSNRKVRYVTPWEDDDIEPS